MPTEESKKRYSSADLLEFKELILKKLDSARKELEYARGVLKRKDGNGSEPEGLPGNMKPLEDSMDTLEKEQLSQLASHHQKFIDNLELALERIRMGTYGICVDTGELIPKERLRLVPHTLHSIRAKLEKD
ncbi:MAG: TraR/DksA C4-type zinc finger protein [Cytophagales bacterium]|nr:TraR/DksA C4-type zinc finger protein [Cytophagales bacterium]